MTKTMSFVATRVIAAAALAGLVGACSGHGVNPATQSGTMTIPATPQSVSPAKIPVAPMAKTAIQPASAMNVVKPMDAIGPANWQPIPGSGTFIAAAPDGSIWVLSGQPAGPDKFIWHYVNGVWTNISGQASRLAVGPDGTLYAINSGGGAYSYNASTSTWTGLGGGCSDIAVAKDGSVYVLSNAASAGSDQAIWHYLNGTWTQVAGSGVRIAGNWDTQTYTINNGGGTIAAGGIYILNAAGSIYYENTSGAFALLPGQASAIAPTSNAGVLMLGYPASGSGGTIFYFDLDAQTYSQPGSSAVGISTNTSNIYAVGSAGGLYYSVVSTSGSLPTTFFNNSGLSSVWITIVGQNPNDRSDPAGYHVTSSGQFVKNLASDADPNGYVDYNFVLPSSNAPFPLPLMRAGRIYVAIGTKIKLQMEMTNHLIMPPIAWDRNDSANYKTMFDWLEFDYLVGPDSHQPGMGINTTAVQMLGIPMALTLTGPTSGTQTSGFKPGARSAIINALQADPTFSSLIVTGTATGTSISPIRAVTLDNALKNAQTIDPTFAPKFSNPTYFDTYITNVWNFYKSNTLTANSTFGIYSGTVNSSNQMVFSQAGKPDIVINKPPSADAIIGNGALTETPCTAWPPDSALHAACTQIGSMLSAAFNRTTLLIDQNMYRVAPCPTSYLNELYQGSTVNLFAKLVHQNSYPTADAPNGGNYGFGFDDNCDQSSVVIDNKNPSSMTVTIQPF